MNLRDKLNLLDNHLKRKSTLEETANKYSITKTTVSNYLRLTTRLLTVYNHAKNGRNKRFSYVEKYVLERELRRLAEREVAEKELKRQLTVLRRQCGIACRVGGVLREFLDKKRVMVKNVFCKRIKVEEDENERVKVKKQKFKVKSEPSNSNSVTVRNLTPQVSGVTKKLPSIVSTSSQKIVTLVDKNIEKENCLKVLRSRSGEPDVIVCKPSKTNKTNTENDKPPINKTVSNDVIVLRSRCGVSQSESTIEVPKKSPNVRSQHSKPSKTIVKVDKNIEKENDEPPIETDVIILRSRSGVSQSKPTIEVPEKSPNVRSQHSKPSKTIKNRKEESDKPPINNYKTVLNDFIVLRSRGGVSQSETTIEVPQNTSNVRSKESKPVAKLNKNIKEENDKPPINNNKTVPSDVIVLRGRSRVSQCEPTIEVSEKPSNVRSHHSKASKVDKNIKEENDKPPICNNKTVLNDVIVLRSRSGDSQSEPTIEVAKKTPNVRSQPSKPSKTIVKVDKPPGKDAIVLRSRSGVSQSEPTSKFPEKPPNVVALRSSNPPKTLVKNEDKVIKKETGKPPIKETVFNDVIVLRSRSRVSQSEPTSKFPEKPPDVVALRSSNPPKTLVTNIDKDIKKETDKPPKKETVFNDVIVLRNRSGVSPTIKVPKKPTTVIDQDSQLAKKIVKNLDKNIKTENGSNDVIVLRSRSGVSQSESTSQAPEKPQNVLKSQTSTTIEKIDIDKENGSNNVIVLRSRGVSQSEPTNQVPNSKSQSSKPPKTIVKVNKNIKKKGKVNDQRAIKKTKSIDVRSRCEVTRKPQLRNRSGKFVRNPVKNPVKEEPQLPIKPNDVIDLRSRIITAQSEPQQNEDKTSIKKIGYQVVSPSTVSRSKSKIIIHSDVQVEHKKTKHRTKRPDKEEHTRRRLRSETVKTETIKPENNEIKPREVDENVNNNIEVIINEQETEQNVLNEHLELQLQSTTLHINPLSFNHRRHRFSSTDSEEGPPPKRRKRRRPKIEEPYYETFESGNVVEICCNRNLLPPSPVPLDPDIVIKEEDVLSWSHLFEEELSADEVVDRINGIDFEYDPDAFKNVKIKVLPFGCEDEWVKEEKSESDGNSEGAEGDDEEEDDDAPTSQAQQMPPPHQLPQPPPGGYRAPMPPNPRGGPPRPMGGRMPGPRPMGNRSPGGMRPRGPMGMRPRGPPLRGVRPPHQGRPQNSAVKRPAPQSMDMKRRRNDVLTTEKDDDDCQVICMQPKNTGLPQIESVQGGPEGVENTIMKLPDSITLTKKVVSPQKAEAKAVANVLASRGITVTASKPKDPPPKPNVSTSLNGVSISPKKAQDDCPTVDLTDDPPTNNSKGLPYKCDLCNAQYPNAQGLNKHTQQYHKTKGGICELGVPLINLKQPGIMQKLSSLGINNYVPLLGAGSDGRFALPIISTRNPGNMQALGATQMLSLGQVRPIPKNGPPSSPSK